MAAKGWSETWKITQALSSCFMDGIKSYVVLKHHKFYSNYYMTRIKNKAYYGKGAKCDVLVSRQKWNTILVIRLVVIKGIKKSIITKE